jgi:hypothetical protein
MFNRILQIITALAVVAGSLATAGVLPVILIPIAGAVGTAAGVLSKSPVNHPTTTPTT